MADAEIGGKLPCRRESPREMILVQYGSIAGQCRGAMSVVVALGMFMNKQN